MLQFLITVAQTRKSNIQKKNKTEVANWLRQYLDPFHKLWSFKKFIRNELRKVEFFTVKFKHSNITRIFLWIWTFLSNEMVILKETCFIKNLYSKSGRDKARKWKKLIYLLSYQIHSGFKKSFFKSHFFTTEKCFLYKNISKPLIILLCPNVCCNI